MSLSSSVRRLRAAAILPLLALAAACDDPSGADPQDRPALLAAGGEHSCALTNGGTAYCWGLNDRGQLGDETRTNSATPVRVRAPERLVDISASDRQTCAVGASGSLYCWGFVAHGADPPFNGAASPDRVTAEVGYARVSAGLRHGCALDRQGRALCWGSDETGQLGNGAALQDTPAPVAVAGGLAFGSIHSAALHTCALAEGGAAYCWGYVALGVVGDGANFSERSPVAVGGGLSFSWLDTGASWACGVSGGSVYCWGMNLAGELAREPVRDGVFRDPAAVAGLSGVRQVFASRQNSIQGHNCALTDAGEAWCWGENEVGETGIDPDGACVSGFGPTCTPTPVRAAPGLRFGTLALGGAHTCGISTQNEIHCWGRSAEGQLGPDLAAGGATPVKVELPQS